MVSPASDAYENELLFLGDVSRRSASSLSSREMASGSQRSAFVEGLSIPGWKEKMPGGLLELRLQHHPDQSQVYLLQNKTFGIAASQRTLRQKALANNQDGSDVQFIPNLQRKIYASRGCLPLVARSFDGGNDVASKTLRSMCTSMSESVTLPSLSKQKVEPDETKRPTSKKTLRGQTRSPEVIGSLSVPQKSWSQPDPKIVLTRFQTNLYDTTVPPNDNFLEVIIEKRRNLGWVVDLPDLALGSRKKLAQLLYHVDPSAEKQLAKGVDADQSDGTYFYALQRTRKESQERYNPYDLQIVSANEARPKALYFLGTTTSVIRVVRTLSGENFERSQFLEWLWERNLFYQIFHLKVFRQFRIWKTFKVWRRNVRMQKQAVAGVRLNKDLFLVNEYLRGCLIHVRHLCSLASSFPHQQDPGGGAAAVGLLRLDSTVTMTLMEFVELQRNQCRVAEEKLQRLRNVIVDIVLETCIAVAEREGITEGIRDADEDDDELKHNHLQPDSSSSIWKPVVETEFKRCARRSHLGYEVAPVLPTGGTVTYTQLVEWRRILHRLSQFLHLVDFILQEMLRSIVERTIEELTTFVASAAEAGRELDSGAASELVSDGIGARPPSSASLPHPPVRRPPSGATKRRTSSGKPRSPVTRATSQASSVHLSTLEGVACFDFSRRDEAQQLPDVDKILKELDESREVVLVPEPIMSIELRLLLPSSEQSEEKSSSLRSASRTSRLSKRTSSAVSGSSRAQSPRKSVQFSQRSKDEESMENGDEMEGESEDDADDRTSSADGRSSRKSSSLAATVTLSPDVTDIRNSFEAIETDFHRTVATFSSLLTEPRLSAFYSLPKRERMAQVTPWVSPDDEEEKEEAEEEVDGDEEEAWKRVWPGTRSMLEGNGRCVETRNRLMNYVDRTLEDVEAFAMDYQKYSAMVEKGRQVEADDSWKQKQWTVEQFQWMLTTFTEQSEEMESMNQTNRFGFIQFHANQFLDDCRPFPARVLDAVRSELPKVAVERNEQLINTIKTSWKKLDKVCDTVEEFVEHMTFIGKVNADLSGLEKEYYHVTKLFTIANDFGMNVEPEEFAVYQNLSPSFQQLKSAIIYAEAKLDDHIVKFSGELETRMQEMAKRVTSLKNEVMDPVFLSQDTLSIVALQKIEVLADEVDRMLASARNFASYRERFTSSLTRTRKLLSEEMNRRDQNRFEPARDLLIDLGEIERDLRLRRLLWDSQQEWDRVSAEWIKTSFDLINVDHLQKYVNRLTQTVFVLEKGLPHNNVVPQLKNKVMDFKQLMPCIASLRNPSLKPRHWFQIESLLEKSIVNNSQLTLGNLRDMKVIRHKSRLQEISTRATSEAMLEQTLARLSDLWQTTDLRLVPHSTGSVCIISGADELFTQLEESQVTIGTIRGSRYVAPIKGEVEDWERRLQLLSKTMDVWLVCQRNWIYLEQIFTASDIHRQLPNESKLFDEANGKWAEIMRKTAEQPNALRSATAVGVMETLSAVNAQLEKIQKCLSDYLETKRLVFPRFYFLSNEDLLDVLVQSKNPNAIQSCLGKCFAGIKTLDIQTLPRQPPTVRTMTSPEGEVVAMPKSLRARGPVEQWLGNVETAMYDTVRKNIRLGLSDWSECKQRDWILDHPGQIALVVTQILFSHDITSCLDSSERAAEKLKNLKAKVVRSLDLYAELLSTDLPLSKRLALSALLTISVHGRDVIGSLIASSVTQSDEFDWTRQLRYTWDERSKECDVIQSIATFRYGYEYLGCSTRLVITPLTDRCYLTLTGALHLHLGGAPAGPAGTGKTETVKDLARGMGKHCIVFNCSEGLDVKTLGQFFSGLSQSGSWYCFDEFNRIDVEVLSVVAQQLHAIKTAKDHQLPRFVFEGRDIRLNASCAVFITMNPSYAGRVELPDNLKFFFRPVAMVVPDYVQIAEILLFSEGFSSARSLSAKAVSLYQLASRQLSQQDHYDFGMRAIKSVVMMSGQKKRQIQLSGQPVVSHEMETRLIIQVLLDANVPKFLSEDVPVFHSLLSDLFPGADLLGSSSQVLNHAISLAIQDHGLIRWSSQVEKAEQFYHQILVRHGVMIVGPTCAGKTVVRNILQRALVLLPTVDLDEDGATGGEGAEGEKKGFSFNNRRRGQVETVTINPKCVTLGELYGQTDEDTLEWSDGLLANAVRRFSKGTVTTTTGVSTETRNDGSPTERNMKIDAGKPDVVSAAAVVGTQTVCDSAIADSNTDDFAPSDWQWIVLDGPVDTLWVENLNTALDDSRTLCLPNAERIPLPSNLRVIFEVDDLSMASPATVSRCAMVYMDPLDLGWQPFVRTWLSRLPPAIPESGRSYLQLMFDHSIGHGLDFIRRFRQHLVLPVPELNLVTSLCNILSAYFDFMRQRGGGFGGPVQSPTRMSLSSMSPGSESSNGGGYKGSLLTDSISVQGHREFFLQKNPNLLNVLLGKLFVFAFVWGIGGNFRREDDKDDEFVPSKGKSQTKQTDAVDVTDEFDSFVRELFEVEPPCGVRLPSSSRNIFSYFVDLTTGNFVVWDNLVPSTQSLIEQGAMVMTGETTSSVPIELRRVEFDLVATIDTVRFSFLSALLLLQKNPVLITGETGIGKSVLIKRILQQLERDGGGRDGSAAKRTSILGSVLNYSEKSQNLLDHVGLIGGGGEDGEDDEVEMTGGFHVGTHRSRRRHVGLITAVHQFSTRTSTARAQAVLTSRLLKKTRDRLGAPKDKQVIVCIDDLNMPAPEQYGAQPALELLRQFLDFGGFFDTKKCSWKDVNDVTLICACGQPGGGRNDISQRLLKHFSVFALPRPSNFTLQHIYQVHLGRFLSEGNFLPEVKDCLRSLVSAALAIYRRACLRLRPTPTKLHYAFSFADISKVMCGMFQSKPSIIVSRLNVIELLVHEVMCVFHDRLVNDLDRMTFCENLSDVVYENFKIRWTSDELMLRPFCFADFDSSSSISSDTGRIYKPLADQSKLKRVLEEIHLQTNSGDLQVVFFQSAAEHVLRVARVLRQPSGHMMLVGLDGMGKSTSVRLAAHIARCTVHRLNLTRGYDLHDFRNDLKKVYVSAGVHGNRTVLLLSDDDIIQESFLEDVSGILSSGEVSDLFDNEEMDGIRMELRSASAAGIDDVPDTRQDVHQFFIQRVRQNLHVVLLCQAGAKFRDICRRYPSLINRSTIDWYNEWDTGAMLSVANAYFHDDQFLSAAQETTTISANPNGNIVDDKMSDVIAKICVEVHKSVVRVAKKFWQETRRRDYVTPFTYVEMMRVYSSMLRKKRDEMELTRSRLLAGLGRLSEANSLVGSMQVELVELGPKIEAKAKDTEALLEQLVSAQEAVVQVRQIVRVEEETMQEEKQVVHEYAQECQRDVDSVVPMLESAIESLSSLEKSDIVEIRVYTNPPSIVTMVIFGICLLLNQEAKDWNHARQIVTDPHFLQRLIDLEEDLLPEKVFTKLKKYTSHPDFTPEKVGTVSRACRSLCEWVLAVEHHHYVFRMAKPKRQRLEEAEEALALARDNLAQKQKSLEKIEGHLKVLQRHYDDSVNQREALKQRKELTAVRLERAAVLIQALSIEKDRWTESARQLEQKMRFVTGDMLLSSATVVYAGVFTGKYRKTLVREWIEICERHSLPVTSDYSFVRSLATDSQVLRWQSKGLPHDIHSVENAVIIEWSRKWPLIIDPQGQAAQWIQEMEGKQLTTVRITNANYLRNVENGIRDGKTVIIQDVGETLDPALDPVFRRKTFYQGSSKMIRIGGVDQEYNDDFRLYVTTSLFNPDYLPSVFNHLTIINFTVTFNALQEQLLSRVVRKEEPELETERHVLMSGIANDLQTLTDLEDKTLALLHTSEGHILDRVDLIETLQHSKEMSTVIKDRVEQSERTEERINGVRKKYLPVATRGSVIYFVVADLAAVEVMYQFSLAWFQDIFDSCLTDVKLDHQKKTDGREESTLNRDDTLATATAAVANGNGEKDAGDVTSELRHRLQAMIDRVTLVVFRLVSTGLFSRHQLMFAFALYTSILRSNRQHRLVASGDVKTGSLPEVDAGDLPRADEISEEEWTVFLQGNAHEMITGGGGDGSVNEVVPANSVPPSKSGSSGPSWLTESVWLQCVHLERSVAGGFDGLCESLMGSSQGQWQTVLGDSDPYHLMGQAFTDPVPSRVVFPSHHLSHFQRLMLLKILRPSALTTAMRCFIEDDFGRDFVASHLNRLQEAFERSTAKTPIVFVVSPGSNPMSELVSLATEVRGSAIHLDVISLGRGQGEKAEELISKSQILKGRWIFLQNCHLAASWMPRLQAIVNNFSKPGVEFDSNFRLWLSSKSYPSFPLSVLQAGIKITVEPPRGVKAKLEWTYSGDRGTGLGVSEVLHDSMGPERTGSWRCLLFGLSFFNAVLQERWKYNQLGWNVCYDFNDADLEVSILQLQQLLTNHISGHHLPWPALWYVIGDVIYGGRVTDDWDRRCLQTMLRRFCNEDNSVSSTAFTNSTDQVYRCIPGDWNYAQVRSYIEELPAEESPELFGMDRNADEAARESEGKQLIDSLTAIQPRLDRSCETFASMKTNDELVMEMAVELERRLPCRVECHVEDGIVPKVSSQVVRLGLNEVLEIARETTDSEILVKLKKLEEEKKEKGIDISGAFKHVQSLGQSAMFTVLYQEIKRFEALLEVIRRSLEALILGVKGEIIMSKGLEEMYDAFVHQRMPQEWKTASYETCKSLGAWTKDLKRRIDFFRLWSIRLVSSAEQSFRVRLNHQPRTMNREPDEDRPLVTEDANPSRYWLSAFYFPQGFLTALLQNHARKSGISVDTLSYTFQIGSSQWIDAGNRAELSLERLCFAEAEALLPAGGAVVWGLYLDGAAWDATKGRLCDSPPGQRFCALPEIHFCPTVISDAKEATAEKKYECPIYQTTRRVQNLSWVSGGTQFVTSVLLDTDRDPERWILRGVALVCQLDD